MSDEQALQTFEEWVDTRLREVAASVAEINQKMAYHEKQAEVCHLQAIALRGSAAGLQEAKKKFLSGFPLEIPQE